MLKLTDIARGEVEIDPSYISVVRGGIKKEQGLSSINCTYIVVGASEFFVKESAEVISKAKKESSPLHQNEKLMQMQKKHHKENLKAMLTIAQSIKNR